MIFVGSTISVYGMKTMFFLFESPFKIHKNGIFLFEISVFVFDVFLLCKLDQ